MRRALVVLSGPSGVGKDAVIAAWRRINPHVTRAVSYTTRAARTGEMDGIDYHFVDIAQFDALARRGKFIDERVIFGARYGLAKSSLAPGPSPACVLVINVDVLGACELMRLHPEAITVFLLPGSQQEIEKRQVARGNPDSRRMARAEMEMMYSSRYQHRIHNRSVDETAYALEALLPK